MRNEFLLLATMAQFDVTVATLLLEGEPGCGKSYFARSFSKYWGATLLFTQCYTGFGEEKLLFDFDPSIMADAISSRGTAAGREALKQGILTRGLLASQQGRVVIVLDELDKSSPSTDAFLLSFLQDCELNDPILGNIKGVRENLVVICTSNGNRAFEDALSRRWVNFQMEFPSREEMKVILQAMMPNQRHLVGHAVSFLYSYRALGCQKTLVQNEVVRFVEVCSRLPKTVAAAVAHSLVSPHKEDIVKAKSLINNFLSQICKG